MRGFTRSWRVVLSFSGYILRELIGQKRNRLFVFSDYVGIFVEK